MIDIKKLISSLQDKRKVFHSEDDLKLSFGMEILQNYADCQVRLERPVDLEMIDWNDKDGLCWITKLTNMVKYGDTNPEVEDEIENSFIRKWLSKLGITIDKQRLTFLLYSILTISWFYAYNRLMKKYKIKLFPDNMTRYSSYTFVLSWLIITYI